MIIKYFQLWRCEICRHEFYTSEKKKQNIFRRVMFRKERIKCAAFDCGKVTAKRIKVVKKEFKEMK